MRKNFTKSQSGFTIIEVLIVLAIAGLILLVVFLAVPGLQRNAHNTTAKNDVAAVLGAVNEYTNNNSGALPTQASGSGNQVSIGGATSCSTAGANCATAKVGYYDASNISISTSATVPSAPATGTLIIVSKATCSGNTPVISATTARSVAAYYTLEGGAVQCQSS